MAYLLVIILLVPDPALTNESADVGVKLDEILSKVPLLSNILPLTIWFLSMMDQSPGS